MTDRAFARATDRTNRVMDLALREALQLGHSYVAPEHILLGILREGENTAAVVLSVDYDLDLGGVRRTLINRMAQPPHRHGPWKVVGPTHVNDPGKLKVKCEGCETHRWVPNSLEDIPDAG